MIPTGSHVVLLAPINHAGAAIPAGTVGVVVHAPVDPVHSYRVRMADETEVSVRGDEIAVRKLVQRSGLTRDWLATGTIDLDRDLIFRCVIGSQAYGLDEPGSDVDRRGVYLAPADVQWSIYGAPEQIENDAEQSCYWEMGKFVTLALKANPNVLECLYSPLVERATPVGQRLLDERTIFLSRLIYQTYNGYVLSQFKKLEQDARRGALRWKHAMHLIRLLLAGIVALREGQVPVRVNEHRDRLLAIRRGDVAWDEVNGWRLTLHREFDTAYACTVLPERPDYDRANRLLIDARRSALAGDRP